MVACFAEGLNFDNIVADDTTKYAVFHVLQIFFSFLHEKLHPFHVQKNIFCVKTLDYFKTCPYRRLEETHK